MIREISVNISPESSLLEEEKFTYYILVNGKIIVKNYLSKGMVTTSIIIDMYSKSNHLRLSLIALQSLGS